MWWQRQIHNFMHLLGWIFIHKRKHNAIKASRNKEAVYRKWPNAPSKFFIWQIDFHLLVYISQQLYNGTLNNILLDNNLTTYKAQNLWSKYWITWRRGQRQDHELIEYPMDSTSSSNNERTFCGFNEVPIRPNPTAFPSPLLLTTTPIFLKVKCKFTNTQINK